MLYVWSFGEHNCEITPWYPFQSNFFMLLEFITLEGFPWIPIRSMSFPYEGNLMKIYWKLRAIVPNDCNHWTPNTTSTPPIWMEIMGLSKKFSLVLSLIIWHFPKQFMVPPSTIITWNSGVVNKNQLRSFSNLQLMKLWVLPESINIVTFFLLMCPCILRVCGVMMSVNAWQDIVGVFSSRSSSCDGSSS